MTTFTVGACVAMREGENMSKHQKGFCHEPTIV
jgi:hypothetical protein